MEKLKTFLDKNKIEYIENFDLSSVSAIKIGDRALIAIFPKTEIELEKLILSLQSRKIYFKIVGNASNLLFVSKLDFPVIVTSKMIDEIKISGREATVSAGILLPYVCEHLKKRGLSGFEGLSGIPATIGGAIVSGAGAFGFNIFDHLVSVRAIVRGKIVTILKSEINFKHHFSNLDGVFVLSAKFLFDKSTEYDIMNLQNRFAFLRAKSQPLGLSLGCVYQKVGQSSAGFFIERSGLKGKRVGGIMVSNKHANFFVNDGTGSATDFLRLAAMVEAETKEHFGVSLLNEIEKVGDTNETHCRLSHSFKQLKI